MRQALNFKGLGGVGGLGNSKTGELEGWGAEGFAIYRKSWEGWEGWGSWTALEGLEAWRSLFGGLRGVSSSSPPVAPQPPP